MSFYSKNRYADGLADERQAVVRRFEKAHPELAFTVVKTAALLFCVWLVEEEATRQIQAESIPTAAD